MKKRTIVLYLILFAASLFLLAYSGSSPKEKLPLQLELVLPKHKFEAGEPIECKAVLTYVGEEDSVKVYFDNPIITFAVDGGEYLHGELEMYGPRHDIITTPLSRKLIKGEPLEFPFQKRQYTNRIKWNSDDEAAKAFWDHYRSSSELTLEPGRYKILARCSYSLTSSSPWQDFQDIIVSEKITVK